MTKTNCNRPHDLQSTPDPIEKPDFEAPKMTYVKPSIERHAIVDVTAGFFGTFYGG